MSDYLTQLTVLAALDLLIKVFVIPWVLLSKKEPTAALAWSLAVLLVPLLGALLFWVFGHNHVNRPLRRKRSHRALYRLRHPEAPRADVAATPAEIGRAHV